jgi:hypothetical protein
MEVAMAWSTVAGVVVLAYLFRVSLRGLIDRIHRIEITPEGLEVETQYSEEFLKWRYQQELGRHVQTSDSDRELEP